MDGGDLEGFHCSGLKPFEFYDQTKEMDGKMNST
jgi:hypothetical protein